MPAFYRRVDVLTSRFVQCACWVPEFGTYDGFVAVKAMRREGIQPCLCMLH